MTPDAYKWPTVDWCEWGCHEETAALRQRIADLETEADTLAASLRLAATLIRPNRESQ